MGIDFVDPPVVREGLRMEWAVSSFATMTGIGRSGLESWPWR